jgi:DNA-3-methyladenine glycosylase
MRIIHQKPARLARTFFEQPTLRIARGLLGMRLVKLEPLGASHPMGARGRRLSGIIIEAEAYIGGGDLGCHASRGGRTPRNAALFGPPGTAYIYFTYGMHWLLNVVTEREGFPAAVLVRAMIPDEGRETMRRRRAGREPVAGGPAMICQALHLDGRWNGSDLCEKKSQLFLERAFSIPEEAVTTGPRVGLYTVPEPWKSIPWRFRVVPGGAEVLEGLVKENRSRPKPGERRRKA